MRRTMAIFSALVTFSLALFISLMPYFAPKTDHVIEYAGGWSPDNQQLAVSSWDGRLTLWDAESSVPARTLSLNITRSLLWSPNGYAIIITNPATMSCVLIMTNADTRCYQRHHLSWRPQIN